MTNRHRMLISKIASDIHLSVLTRYSSKKKNRAWSTKPTCTALLATNFDILPHLLEQIILFLYLDISLSSGNNSCFPDPPNCRKQKERSAHAYNLSYAKFQIQESRSQIPYPKYLFQIPTTFRHLRRCFYVGPDRTNKKTWFSFVSVETTQYGFIYLIPDTSWIKGTKKVLFCQIAD
ncbi:hypothetical protein PHYBLDRAFT_187568 [Phycomyces blakesleeanus NRRL 1555(-)]|uniref:Uncharacterized protein n=1 Tax=Phycomyces blakesleeanus (strain ATCC 8743b / DSM 1359 / FGSC 10004 / NBRC 33097 / NRRL 1555) TaxID=763407 RepID=A0A167M0U3_PHYB8|nr:hypothetical protein PHYBLDRAFT_187568 [Phycomyces blakesleeanus NRRL 1555(-)]OAD71478.1 hypothetical protein PHYBLDRAFT_187568 [Phycomyces blakesleeanus NRRL 1555(-)]|eukprot:XP_018289518.1 hypothetical protein PHYBLDRAFT_187568 [Phycomyces blakesleeanus NRRL 1555(-)]